MVAYDHLGCLSHLSSISQDDRAKSRDRRCDREERGQRARFQLADSSRRQPRGSISADSLTADAGARRPATASNAVTTACTAAGTASTASTDSTACLTPTATGSGWSNDSRRCLRRFGDVILTRGRGDCRCALRDCAVIGRRYGDGSGALCDGAFVAVGLGQGGSSLHARCAPGSNCLGGRGSGHRGPGSGADLRATGRAENDHVTIVGPRYLR